MEFKRVNDMKERHALVNKFLENRKVLKDHFIEEKLNKQQFQKYVAQPLAQPLKTHLDEKQDKLIKEMQDEQKVMGEKQDAIVKAVEDIPHNEGIGLNLDFGLADVDKEILDGKALPLASEIYIDYIKGETTIENISSLIAEIKKTESIYKRATEK